MQVLVFFTGGEQREIGGHWNIPIKTQKFWQKYFWFSIICDQKKEKNKTKKLKKNPKRWRKSWNSYSIFLWSSSSVSPDRYFLIKGTEMVVRAKNSWLHLRFTYSLQNSTLALQEQFFLILLTWIHGWTFTESQRCLLLYPELMYYSWISLIVKKTWH